MSEGYVFMVAPCGACHRLFSFNPHLVPSFRFREEREPICPACMERANAKRKELGLPPHQIMQGAYEPLPETEL